MKEGLSRLMMLIMSNREDVEEIIRSGDEYYFKFRGKFFSVSRRNPIEAFFAYPKWHGTLTQLIQGIDSTPYAHITAGEAKSYLGADYVSEIYRWLESKDVGLDELLRDLGID